MQLVQFSDTFQLDLVIKSLFQCNQGRGAYEYWIYFGFLGLILGFVRNEKVFFLKRIITLGVIAWTLIGLQFYFKYKTPAEIFFCYSIYQLTIFLVLYKLSDYFNREELNKHIEERLAQRLVQEHAKFVPTLAYTNFTIIKGKAHIRERDEALKSARRSIVITSGWVSDFVITPVFLKSIQDLLDRGIKMRIVYGYKDKKGAHSSSQAAVLALQKLETSNSANLKIVVAPNHTKVIIVDNKYAICGSFNWLSNNKVTNEEISFKSTEAEVIKELNSAIRNLIT